MSSLVQVLLGAAVAFAEALPGVGLVLPGELAITGLAASLTWGQSGVLIVAVALGASLGDHLNYLLGRRYGARLGESRLVRRLGRHHWDRAMDVVRRRGAWALISTRLIPVVRTLMSGVAGASQMPYRRFAIASLTGSFLWSAVWVSAGAAVSSAMSNPLLVVPLLGVLIGLLGVRAHRRRRRERSGQPRVCTMSGRRPSTRESSERAMDAACCSSSRT